MWFCATTSPWLAGVDGRIRVADHEVRIITKMDNTQLDKAADHAEEKN